MILVAVLALVGVHFTRSQRGSVLAFKNPIGSGDGVIEVLQSDKSQLMDLQVVPEKDLSFVKSEEVSRSRLLLG